MTSKVHLLFEVLKRYRDTKPFMGIVFCKLRAYVADHFPETSLSG